MANKIQDEDGNIGNNTDTNLDILKSLERSFYKANPASMKRNTVKSLSWFRQFVPKNYNTVRTARMFRDRDMWTDRVVPGQLVFFEYDALHKDTLPVWDRFPLVFFFNSHKSKEGKEILTGINLHYLKPEHRFVAFKSLLTLRSEKRYRKSTKLQLSWDVLKAMSTSKYFEHSVKMYRVDHIQSKFVNIPARSWELAVFLPLARWQKGSKAEAWRL